MLSDNVVELFNSNFKMDCVSVNFLKFSKIFALFPSNFRVFSCDSLVVEKRESVGSVFNTSCTETCEFPSPFFNAKYCCKVKFGTSRIDTIKREMIPTRTTKIILTKCFSM